MSKQKPTPDQQAAADAKKADQKKASALKEFFDTGAKRIGEATRQTFITAIKHTGCTDDEAAKVFADAVKSGKVKCGGVAGIYPGIEKYFAK